MNRRQHAAARSRRSGCALALLAALATALPAAAAELLKVRVGAHPGYTRVVFELDRSAGYRVEKAGTEQAPELRVTLEAATGAKQAGAHGDVRGVTVAPGESAVARIPLRRSGLHLREMILSNPPRIVLDLRRPEPVAAATPKPAPRPEAKIAAQPKPEPEAAPAPDPKPEPEAAPEPEPLESATAEPEPVPDEEPAHAEEPAEQAPADAAAQPEAGVEPSEPELAGEPATAGGEPAETASEAAPPRPALLPPDEPWPPVREAEPAKPAPKTAAQQLPVPSRPAADAAGADTASEPGWLERLTGNPLWLGAAVGGLVALVGIAVTLRRRSRSLPDDLDVTAIARELDGDGDGRVAGSETPRAAASEASGDESPFGDLFDSEEPAASAPRSDLPSDRSAPAPSAGAAPALELADEPSPAPDSIFDEASEEEAPMNQDMDLPADRRLGGPPPTGRAGMDAGSSSSDVAQRLEAFELRIQGLEAKLEEAHEAREKLERQVAAQSEELRVQRAAIARTQRALRTMSRGDEDKATEPALRDGDTQAKTRING